MRILFVIISLLIPELAVQAQEFFIKPAIECKMYSNFHDNRSYTNQYFSVVPIKFFSEGIQPVTFGLHAGVKFNNLIHLSVGYSQETSVVGYYVYFNQYDEPSKANFASGFGNKYYSFSRKIPITLILPFKTLKEYKKYKVSSSICLGAALFIQNNQEISFIDFGTVEISNTSKLSLTSTGGSYRTKKIMLQLGWQIALIKNSRQKLDLTIFYEGNFSPVMFQQVQINVNVDGVDNYYFHTMEGRATGFGLRIARNIYFTPRKQKMNDAKGKSLNHREN